MDVVKRVKNFGSTAALAGGGVVGSVGSALAVDATDMATLTSNTTTAMGNNGFIYAIGAASIALAVIIMLIRRGKGLAGR